MITSKKKVTRNDVAKLAGTSSAVVSYVINNGPRPVSDKVRQKVLEAIRITGYRPNNIAKALASGKSNCIGLVIPNIANPFIATLAHAIECEAIKRGFVILLGDSDDNQQQEYELLNFFLQRQVDGIIYNAIKEPYFELLHSIDTPFVLLNPINKYQGSNIVKIDESKAAFDIVLKMLDFGYQKIAIICGPEGMNNTHDRILGWKQALLSKGIMPDENLIFYSDYTRQAGYKVALEIVDKVKFDGVFTTNEMQAFGALRAFREKNLNVPNDIGLTTFNATELSDFCTPPLTCMKQPVDLVALQTLDMLLEHRDNKCFDIPYKIVDGMSIKKIS